MADCDVASTVNAPTVHAPTIHSELPELEVQLTTIEGLRERVRSVASGWGADQAPDVAEAALALICQAQSGAMVIVGKETSLRSLVVQSEDHGCMDALTQDLGIGSPQLRQTFLDFTNKELSDDKGKWASHDRYPTAQGKAKRGAWIFTELGGRLKAATLLLNLQPAPHKLSDKGMRHTITLMAGCIGSNVAFVRSDAGMLHAFAVKAGDGPCDVQAWRVDSVLPFLPPETPHSRSCLTLPDFSPSEELKVATCTSEEALGHIRSLFAKHSADSALESAPGGSSSDVAAPSVDQAVGLSERFLELLQDEHVHAGATVLIGSDRDFQRMKESNMLQTAAHYMENRTRHVDVGSEAFRIRFLELAVHTENDRFRTPQGRLREGEVADPAAWHKVMDGFWLISLDSGERVKAQCKIVGLQPPPVSSSGFSSRFMSALAAAWYLEGGVVLNRSESGALHAMVSTSGSVRVHCFELLHPRYAETAHAPTQPDETFADHHQDPTADIQPFNVDLAIFEQQGQLDGMQADVQEMAQKLGEEHPRTLALKHDLATCFGQRGDAQGQLQQRTLFEALVPVRVRVQGEEHPGTLASTHELAICRDACGNARGALDLLEALVPVRVRVQGEEHPGTLASTNMLAICRSACGNARGALDLLEALVPVRIRVQGEEHPGTLATKQWLAHCRRERRPERSTGCS